MKLNTIALSLLLSVSAGVAMAQAPAAAPAGTTGICKDGTFSSAAKKAGACSGHKGVKTWLADTDAKSDDKKSAMVTTAKPATAATPAIPAKPAMPAMPATPATAAVPAKPAMPATPATPATAAVAAKPAVPATPATAAVAEKPAAGAAANKVWVNTETKVYHCPGTRYYGKTKKGEYMTEAEATAKGSHADHGKACTK